MSVKTTEKPKTMPSTAAARALVQNAIRDAKEFKHDCVGAEHLLFALVEMPESVIAKVLVGAGVTPDLVRGEMEKLPRPTPEPFGNLPFTPRARRILERAESIARKSQSARITEGHVLLALLKELNGSRPEKWFAKFAIDVEGLRERVEAVVGKP